MSILASISKNIKGIIHKDAAKLDASLRIEINDELNDINKYHDIVQKKYSQSRQLEQVYTKYFPDKWVSDLKKILTQQIGLIRKINSELPSLEDYYSLMVSKYQKIFPDIMKSRDIHSELLEDWKKHFAKDKYYKIKETITLLIKNIEYQLTRTSEIVEENTSKEDKDRYFSALCSEIRYERENIDNLMLLQNSISNSPEWEEKLNEVINKNRENAHRSFENVKYHISKFSSEGLSYEDKKITKEYVYQILIFKTLLGNNFHEVSKENFSSFIAMEKTIYRYDTYLGMIRHMQFSYCGSVSENIDNNMDKNIREYRVTYGNREINEVEEFEKMRFENHFLSIEEKAMIKKELQNFAEMIIQKKNLLKRNVEDSYDFYQKYCVGFIDACSQNNQSKIYECIPAMLPLLDKGLHHNFRELYSDSELEYDGYSVIDGSRNFVVTMDNRFLMHAPTHFERNAVGSWKTKISMKPQTNLMKYKDYISLIIKILSEGLKPSKQYDFLSKETHQAVYFCDSKEYNYSRYGAANICFYTKGNYCTVTFDVIYPDNYEKERESIIFIPENKSIKEDFIIMLHPENFNLGFKENVSFRTFTKELKFAMDKAGLKYPIVVGDSRSTKSLEEYEKVNNLAA